MRYNRKVIMEACPHWAKTTRKGGGTPMKKEKKTRQKGGIVLLALLLLIGVVGVKTIDVAGEIREA